MNFARDIVDAAPRERVALIELAADGARRTWSFGAVADASAQLAGALAARGVGRGDVVMTLIGNRPDWVLTMVACFRLGAVVLPCTEQLRAKDLALRIAVAAPRLIVADRRNDAALQGALEEVGRVDVAHVPDPALYDAAPAAAVELAPADPCLITFTSGTSGAPKAVLHGQRYLAGQQAAAEHWLGAAPGDVVWCTAASGWSKSARNVFIAPWLLGATAVLHDGRFDPAERLDLLEREAVNVLCMAPTEYRLIAKRAPLRRFPQLRELVAAGEALNPEVLELWRAATGLDVRDGYGQTETGQLTGNPAGVPARSGSMGPALPGVQAGVLDGELVLTDPRTLPTFFLGYLGEEVTRSPGGAWQVRDRADGGPWHTGDRVHADDDGYLRFEGRADDVIVSAGYRIGPFEVESALVSHPAVAEAAVVAAPDEARGSVVRAVVVLRAGYAGDADLARALQDHVKAVTAPYKYPRVVDFADELPKTPSGKVVRAALRAP